MKIETVQTDTFTMDYIRFGRGKMPLVILPGLSVQSVMGSADAIAQAFALLCDDFTIFVFDRRNNLPAVYSIHDMALDTAAALQALRLGPVCLFGASQGGMIAMSIAIEHPELVHCMILGSTAASVTAKQQPLFEQWITLAEDGKAEELYLSFGKALYPQSVFDASRELLVSMAKTVTSEELKRFTILARALIGFDILRELEGITCPVLVIGDEDDQVLGADASRQIAGRIPDCELYMYKGFGHAVYDTAPDYRKRMLRFLLAQLTPCPGEAATRLTAVQGIPD